MPPLLILINPWIYDFAAYDLWARPLGLLTLASSLRRSNFRIHMIDCLAVHDADRDESHPLSNPHRRRYGTGKFRREKAARPTPLRDIPRPYSRYGISTQLFTRELERVGRPSAVLVTSLMTYWYPGVQEAIRLTREVHPQVPVILGGLYARLCKGHALRHSGADRVVTESGAQAVESLLRILAEWGVQPDAAGFSSSPHPYPAFDLLPEREAVCLLTSQGCPYRCPYCASHFLHPDPERRDPREVLAEIRFWQRKYGVRDFAFFDDALLMEADSHMALVLETLVRRNAGLRFHTPNALHVREISPEMAKLLFLSGFRTIRLGLETSDMELHRRMGGKVSEGEFERAVANLLRAGYSRREIGAYVLMGLPGQSPDSVRASLELVDRTGATPYLAEYSPIPHTPLWKTALSHSGYDLAAEPLFQNNTLLPCWGVQERSRVPELKDLASRIRRTAG